MLRYAKPARPLRAGIAAMLAACCCGPVPAAQAQTAVSVIRVLAEITAIQLACRSLEVRPGVALQFGESRGVRMVDILPGGRRRGEFEEALAEASMIDPQRLCSSIALRYAAGLPGSVGQR